MKKNCAVVSAPFAHKGYAETNKYSIPEWLQVYIELLMDWTPQEAINELFEIYDTDPHIITLMINTVPFSALEARGDVVYLMYDGTLRDKQPTEEEYENNRVATKAMMLDYKVLNKTKREYWPELIKKMNAR